MPSPLPRRDRGGYVRSSLTRRRPSPSSRWVGSRIRSFEACTAFTCVTACQLAESPSDPFPSKAPTISLPLSPLRLLPAGTTVAGWDLHPLKTHDFARRTRICGWIFAGANHLGPEFPGFLPTLDTAEFGTGISHPGFLPLWRSKRRTTRNKDEGRGCPQGAPISPLLSNLYMRRFVLGWKTPGYDRRLRAKPTWACTRRERRFRRCAGISAK